MPDRETQSASEHPSLEQLSAYVDGTVDDRAREVVESHLASCEDCYELVTEIVQTESHIVEVPEPSLPAQAQIAASRGQANVVSLGRRRWLLAAGGLAAAALLVLGVRFAVTLRTPAEAQPLDELFAALGNTRPVEARLTSQVRYGAYESPMRSERLLSNVRLLAAAAALEQVARRTPSPAAWHAYGIAQLTLGRDDEAITSLQRAADAEPTNASYRADLAAGFLARGAAANGEADRFRALSATENALSLDAGSLSALFNRALALEALGRRAEARAAWETYLSRDADSPWASEARTRLQQLSSRQRGFDIPQELQRIRDSGRVRREAFATASWGEINGLQRALIADWAGDSTGAERALQWAAEVGEAASPRFPDALVHDEIIRLLQLSPEQRRVAANAHRDLRSAIGLQEDFRHFESLAPLGSARQNMRSLALPFAIEADLHLALAESFLRRTVDAERHLEAVAKAAEERGYLTIAGRAQSSLGILVGGQARYADALDHYSAGSRLYAQNQDSVSAAYVDNLVAEIMHLCGRFDEAFKASSRALARIDEYLDRRRQQSVLFVAAALSSKTGLWGAALDFQRAFVRIAEAGGQATASAEGRIALGRTLDALGRRTDAAQEFALVESIVAAHPDQSRRAFLLGELYSTRGSMAGAADSAVALDDLQRAAELLSEAGRRERLPTILLRQARLLRREGAMDRAVTRANQAFEAIDREWTQLVPSDLTKTRLEELWWLIAEAVSTRFDAGRSDEALELLERYKTAILSQTKSPALPSALPALRQALDRRSGAVFFAPTDSETLLWVFTAERTQAQRLPISAPEIRSALAALTSEVPADRTRSLERLYQSLMAPALDVAGPDVRRLYISPLGATQSVPWTALREVNRGRYLGQDFEVTTISSAATATASSCRGEFTPRSAVVVADPSFPRATLDLRRLPEAGREGAAIQALYPAASVLGDEAATKPRFLHSAPDADVVHFAGHAMGATESVDAASLVLAGTTHANALLNASEIRTLQLVRHPVVVLAACRSGHSLPASGPGAPNLPAAFIAAGARAVLSALWDVEDRPTRTLMTGFHQHLRNSSSPPLALQEMVSDALASEFSDVRHWGAFQLTGCITREETTWAP